jgi:hypothetical protein
MDEIPNRNLSLANIPTPDADWIAISAFAHTFDGYEHCGSFERCAEIGNARQPTTLTELRVCLFFAKRVGGITLIRFPQGMTWPTSVRCLRALGRRLTRGSWNDRV